MVDWLFQLPEGDMETAESEVKRLLDEDPVAAAISDDEAAAFVAAAYMIRSAGPDMLNVWSRAIRASVSFHGPKARRRATLLILRKWRDPFYRHLLVTTTPQGGFANYPAVAGSPEVWTDAKFRQAFDGGINIMWLVQVRRYLNPTDDLTPWLSELDPWAETEYRLWLGVGKLTLRKIVWPNRQAETLREVSAAQQEALATALREKDREAKSARRDVRRMQQDRKELKEKARHQEWQVRVALPQARGEVAAAKAALKRRRAAQEEELKREAHTYESQIAMLQQQLAAARAVFVRQLQSHASSPAAPLLSGRPVDVSGPPEDDDIYRLLVRALGGRPGSDQPELIVDAPEEGFASLARILRGHGDALLEVTCDGLYRRLPGRPGIAVAGFHVRCGGRLIYRRSSVVCCGLTAGSLMAEYGALLLALYWLWASDLTGVGKIVVRSDCKAMLRRLFSRNEVRRKLGCVTLHHEVSRLLRALQGDKVPVHIQWVPRDEVTAVDRLCARTYRNLTWYRRRKSGSMDPARRLEDFIRKTVRQHVVSLD